MGKNDRKKRTTVKNIKVEKVKKIITILFLSGKDWPVDYSTFQTIKSALDLAQEKSISNKNIFLQLNALNMVLLLDVCSDIKVFSFGANGII